MKVASTWIAVALLAAVPAMGCKKKQEAPAPEPIAAAPAPAAPAPAPAAPAPSASARKLFLDVHDVGKGKVTAAAAADLRRKDLAVQGKHDVDFKAYWVDEAQGKIYHLVEAPSADAAAAVHREANGATADEIYEVADGGEAATAIGGKKFFIDSHDLGAGKFTAAQIAEGHEKDLAVQGKHGVNFVQYWVDVKQGKGFCLSEAPNAEAIKATHKEAHGGEPSAVSEVIPGT